MGQPAAALEIKESCSSYGQGVVDKSEDIFELDAQTSANESIEHAFYKYTGRFLFL